MSGDIGEEPLEPPVSRLLHHRPEKLLAAAMAPESGVHECIATETPSFVEKNEKRTSHELTLLRPETEDQSLLRHRQSHRALVEL